MYQNIYDKLKVIAAGKGAQDSPTIWVHEVGNPLIGRIKGFSNFQHDRFGLQKTVIVELESGELVSAILNGYLEEGIRRKQARVNDFVLIQLLGKSSTNSGISFNRFQFEVMKDDELF